MKKFLLLLLAILICTGCSPKDAGLSGEPVSDSPAPTLQPTENDEVSEDSGSAETSIKAEDILQLLIEKGLPVDKSSIREIDANNDPEGIFGQPGMGIQKLAFQDSRYTGHECFVVIFDNFEEMMKETEAVNALDLPDSTSCSYGVVTVRIPKMEMLDVITEYQDLFYGLDADQVGELSY